VIADACSAIGLCFHIDQEDADDVILTLLLDVIVIATICLLISYYRAYRKSRK
jgi:hypothetical protein